MLLLMKRLIVIMLMLASVTVWAQDVVRDSVPANADADTAEENVIGGRVVKYHQSKEQNVLGAPIYYDRYGNERGAKRPADNQYRRPERHYLNSLRNSYNSFFFEMEGLFGYSDLAWGANFTYLPNRWGVYGSALFGIHHDYLSVGPALRLSSSEGGVDWHLYSGLMVGRHVGGEIGFRCAAPRSGGGFCWTSASLGMAVVNGRSFVTCGMSLELSALLTLPVVLFW